MDLFVSCPLLPSAKNVLVGDLLTALLHFARDREQGFQLFRNCGHLAICFHTVDELLISVEPVSSHGTVSAGRSSNRSEKRDRLQSSLDQP